MIKVDNLSFSYDKRTEFIKDLSFDVSEGEIFGFLGPSGAGKSTLQKILCGILRSYDGNVNVLGTEMKNRSSSFYEGIGVDFEFPNLYEKFTAIENLNYFASLYSNNQIDALPLLKRVGLLDSANKRVSEFSKGMRMRLTFVRAIMHSPRLLFLDEPTSGLDPTYARIIKDMILEQKNQGKTVILTTHNMHDADELCDRVAFIVDGDIKMIGKPEELKLKKDTTEVKFTYFDSEGLIESISNLSGLYENIEFMEALRLGKIRSIHSKESSLEDVFMEVTGRRLI